MWNTSTPNIQPLGNIENTFLQVLLDRFTLKRIPNGGTRLEVQIRSTDKAIWSNAGKDELRNALKSKPKFDQTSKFLRKKLKSFLLNGEENFWKFYQPDFPFRYVSGGTLPVVRINKTDYYCLFYREIDPVGWNLANGGSDNRAEFLNPIEIIERELREELIAIDIKRRRRYVFESKTGKSFDRPEFKVFRWIIKQYFPELALGNFDEWPIPIKWIEGPDELGVRLDDDIAPDTTGCFLNINAEDHGIEIDRVAKIFLDDDTVLFDGELEENYLVNCPVGLFETRSFNASLGNNDEEFLPDIVYYGAKRYTNDAPGGLNIREIIGEFLIWNKKRDPTLTFEELGKAIEKGVDLNLCPVTKNLALRFLNHSSKMNLDNQGQISPDDAAKENFEVFVCFGEPDVELARSVVNYLRTRLNKRVFFSEEIDVGANWGAAIDDALEKVDVVIVVASSLDNIQRDKVRYEWRSFHNIRDEDTTKLIPFVKGIGIQELPLPLRVDQGIEFATQNQLNTALERLRL